ncbi:hypothetical protein JTB14_003685 [Gonioctena quinquepunctata]|nr:hypothetical protein JTB14_003685 [Gonioctena quinquepunctata]
MPNKGEDGYNKLYKVQPSLTHLSTKFKANFAPSRFISIDESMVAFKGRSKLKPIKRGIKVWAMACANTRYMVDSDVYQGKSENSENLALGEKVVVNLSKSLSAHGYCLYFDNFFPSFPLLQRLLDNKLLACGTFRSNRKQFPHDKLCPNKAISLGQFDFASSGDITVYK